MGCCASKQQDLFIVSASANERNSLHHGAIRLAQSIICRRISQGLSAQPIHGPCGRRVFRVVAR
jgi:hypothetical protein